MTHPELAVVDAESAENILFPRDSIANHRAKWNSGAVDEKESLHDNENDDDFSTFLPSLGGVYFGVVAVVAFGTLENE